MMFFTEVIDNLNDLIQFFLLHTVKIQFNFHNYQKKLLKLFILALENIISPLILVKFVLIVISGGKMVGR